MQFKYNSTDLAALGKVLITGRSAVGEPAEAPQRWLRAISVQVNIHEGTFEDNFTVIRQIETLLLQQEAALYWADDNGTVLLNQSARIKTHDWPERPNVRGKHWQILRITFEYETNFDDAKTACQSATVQRVGSGAPLITLNGVEGCKFGYDSRRYDPLRKHRAMAIHRITLRGRFKVSQTLDVATRRTTLLTASDQMKTELVNSAEIRLKYLTTDQVSRVEHFEADVDQALRWIAWNLDVTFTGFPNESSYGQAEFSVATRENKTEGTVLVSLTGAIAADSLVAAQTKLTALRTAALGSGHALLETEQQSEQVDGGDGAAFIKLTFQETHQKISGQLLSWTLKISDAAEIRQGKIRRTYAGNVVAKAATYEAARLAAVTQAQTLGAGKHAMAISQRVDVDEFGPRQTTGDVVARVEFSFEYLLHGTRAYLEMSSTFSSETFGVDVENARGFVAASSLAAARALFETVRSGYASSLLIRNLEVTEVRSKIAADGSPTGATASPPGTVTQVNASETTDNTAEPGSARVTNPPLLGADYVRQWDRLEFSFQLHRPKTASAMRYEMEVECDYVANVRNTMIRGTVWAANAEAAETYLDAYIGGLSVGNRTRRQRSQAMERPPVSWNLAEAFISLSFAEQFTDTLSAAAAVLRCELEERIDCSGDRVVAQPTAADKVVLQKCGQTQGTRTIHAVCVATTETAALAWVRKQRVLPAPADATQGDKENLPEGWIITPETIPLRELVGRAGDYGNGAEEVNVTVVKVQASFTEIFDELTMA